MKVTLINGKHLYLGNKGHQIPDPWEVVLACDDSMVEFKEEIAICLGPFPFDVNELIAQLHKKWHKMKNKGKDHMLWSIF